MYFLDREAISKYNPALKHRGQTIPETVLFKGHPIRNSGVDIEDYMYMYIHVYTYIYTRERVRSPYDMHQLGSHRK